MHDGDFIVLQGSKERDPHGTRVSAAIRAHYAYERMREIRVLLVYVVAGLSIFIWPLAAWPAFDVARFRGLSLASWAVAFAGLVVASIQERWRFRRRARLMAELHGQEKAA
jgi:hypothetical protein